MEETKTEEKKTEENKSEEKIETPKERNGFMAKMKGKNSKEFVENISFVMIIISGIMVSLGIAIGSFIQGAILMASFGSFLVMAGIVTFILSQFMGVNNG